MAAKKTTQLRASVALWFNVLAAGGYLYTAGSTRATVPAKIDFYQEIPGSVRALTVAASIP